MITYVLLLLFELFLRVGKPEIVSYKNVSAAAKAEG